MKTVCRWLACLMFFQLLGCSINPKVELSTAEILGPRQSEGSKVGIALAGGGTKAAAFSMGVLAALSETDPSHPDAPIPLLKINAISSVSGGGYSSLYLYSKLMLREREEAASRPAIHDYFDDCIPASYASYLPKTATHHPGNIVCDVDPKNNGAFRFQQYVRCRQDVLEMDCRPDGTTDGSFLYSTPMLLAATGAATVPNLIATTIFDWPVNMAPTRFAYKRGIGATYALYPMSIQAAGPTTNIGEICNEDHFINCQLTDNGVELSTDKGKRLGLSELGDFLEHSDARYPVWLINAAASRKRSLMGWGMAGQRDFSRNTLQISPYGARSGLYGKVEVEQIGHFDLLQSVTSAAAFIDANETPLTQPSRFALALGLHLSALDWGVDIDNPNVGDDSRAAHRLLFFPLYYADGAVRLLQGHSEDETRSAYIRLLDGGNNDDLGAFSLLEAGMTTILVSDHSGDDRGKMQDVCLLYNEIQKRAIAPDNVPRYRLNIPGLDQLDEHCAQFAGESSGGDLPMVRNALLGKHYPIWAWRYPVLLGCVRLNSTAEQSRSCAASPDSPILARMIFIKPAFDLGATLAKYTDLHAHKVLEDACRQEERGMCEVAAYLVDLYPNAKVEKNMDRFPQDSTVLMTFGSNAKRYGAYRELARWQTRAALKQSELSESEFQVAVEAQNHCRIKLVDDGNEPITAGRCPD